MSELQGKVAIVTGGGTGIGKAIAEIYASNGAKVVIGGRDEKRNQSVVDAIMNKGGEAIFIQTDVSKRQDCERLVEKTLEKYQRLDIACNNAAKISPLTSVGEYDIDEWENVIDTNLNGVFYGMRYQIPAMLASGGGVIVNIGSIASQVAVRGLAAYVAAKHGLLGLTRVAAVEYADKGIRVNVIGPAYIRTPLLNDILSDEGISDLADIHPIGRIGVPEEVAELALWLSSDKSSFVTGSYYTIDGAYTAQ
ncbi:SDR family NAD(P)-dependent oxidoreductase [Chitinophaga vietnamensis]|uniref:SDR family NAD(P)-dependent oxidoreductase n=1 Tax=Chitinophaga vietnamensis TaxID=2593957 RepID=UPI0011786D9B|nr:glucose 1-dehydrogenase [Chitinophaga vietnamensis]